METQLPLDLPPTTDELRGRTTCGYDGCINREPLMQRDAIVGCIPIGQTLHQEHFCSFRCRDKWRNQYARSAPYDHT